MDSENSFRDLVPNVRKMKDEDQKVPEEGYVLIPNSCRLYWKVDPYTGGRIYYSDEIGGGVTVWNVALVSEATLLAAIVEELGLRRLEAWLEEDK